MKKIIDYFVEKTFIVNLLTFIILLFGAVSLWHLPKRIIDQEEGQGIEVTASLLGASAQQIEKNLTAPLEAALKDLDQLKYISSFSNAHFSRVSLEFDDGANMQRVLQEVNQRIASINNELPSDTKDLEASIGSAGGGGLLASLALTQYDALNLNHFRWLQNFKRKILNIPGVTNIDQDIEKPHITIAFNPEKLSRFGLSVAALRQRILSGLNFAPIGMIKNEKARYLMEIDSDIKDLESIKKIPIKAMLDGPVLTVGDVASVKFMVPKRTVLELIDGRPYGQMWIKTSKNVSLSEATQKLRELIESENSLAPAPIKIENIIDGITFIDRQLDILYANAGYGIALLLTCLILFVGGRISIMVALGVPVAYLGTFVVMDAYSISINLVSFIAIIIILGVLVDDAIVVSEKYSQNLSSGMLPKDAAKKAAHEMFMPVTGGIITTMVAFIPIFMLPGSFRAVLVSLPIIVFSAFILSWFESFFILPNHLAHAVKTKSRRRGIIFEKIKSYFEQGLYKALRWRYAILGLHCICLVLVFTLLIPRLKADNWSVNVNDASVKIAGTLKATSSLDDSRRQIEPLIEEIRKFVPKSSYNFIFSNFGEAYVGGQKREGREYFSLTLYLDQNSKNIDSLTRNTGDIIKPIVEKFRENIVNDIFVTANDSGHSGGNSDSEISLYAYADDYAAFGDLDIELDSLAKETKLLRFMPLNKEMTENIWSFIPNLKNVEEYGLSKNELAEQLASILSEDELGEVRIGSEGFRIFSSLEKNEQQEVSEESLNSIYVSTNHGLTVPLINMGHWQKSTALRQIARINSRTSMNYAFAFAGSDRSAAREELEVMIKPLKEKYRNLEFSLSPLGSEERELKTWAVKAPTYTISLIFFVLALTLHSLSKTIMVWLMIPVGILGVIISLILHNYDLRFMTVIGLLGVAGVAVNASLILIDAIEKYKDEASSPFGRFHKIIKGTGSRLKPIFITMITTLSGVFPAAYGWGGESGYTQPMVFAMAWGILSANLFAIFFLPLIVALSEDLAALPRVIKILLRKTGQRDLGTVPTALH